MECVTHSTSTVAALLAVLIVAGGALAYEVGISSSPKGQSGLTAASTTHSSSTSGQSTTLTTSSTSPATTSKAATTTSAASNVPLLEVVTTVTSMDADGGHYSFLNQLCGVQPDCIAVDFPLGFQYDSQKLNIYTGKALPLAYGQDVDVRVTYTSKGWPLYGSLGKVVEIGTTSDEIITMFPQTCGSCAIPLSTGVKIGDTVTLTVSTTPVPLVAIVGLNLQHGGGPTIVQTSYGSASFACPCVILAGGSLNVTAYSYLPPNYNFSGSFSITGIAVTDQGFSIASITPPLPIKSVFPDLTVTFQVEVNSPNADYTGYLDLSLTLAST